MAKTGLCEICGRTDGKHDALRHIDPRFGIREDVWQGYVARAQKALKNRISKKVIAEAFIEEGQKDWHVKGMIWQASRLNIGPAVMVQVVRDGKVFAGVFEKVFQ